VLSVKAFITYISHNSDQIAISKNIEMFTSNLTTIQAIKISDKAGEWGKLFDQTMQVSITVQEEMRKFQYHDSSD
jgi:hypothetical protein